MAVVLEDLPPLMWHAELGQSLLDMWTGKHQRGGATTRPAGLRTRLGQPLRTAGVAAPARRRGVARRGGCPAEDGRAARRDSLPDDQGARRWLVRRAAPPPRPFPEMTSEQVAAYLRGGRGDHLPGHGTAPAPNAARAGSTQGGSGSGRPDLELSSGFRLADEVPFDIPIEEPRTGPDDVAATSSSARQDRATIPHRAQRTRNRASASSAGSPINAGIRLTSVGN